MPIVHANGIDFEYLEAGSGPLVLCLHGFPDTAHTWNKLLPELAAAGYHAVAPFMRGYPPSSSPKDGDFSVPALGADVIALIEAFGVKEAMIIGHDWGAAAGYCAANIAPHKVTKLITAAVPHPRSLRPWPAQLRRSWYMGFFQLRGIADRKVAKDNFAFIDRLWRDWSPGWDYTDDQIAPVKNAFSKPGAVQSVLSYYRALPKGFRDRKAFKLVMAKTSVPTLTIAGRDDGCLGVKEFERSAAAFSGCFDLAIIDNAGHFMQCEQPERFAQLVLGFLS